MERPTTPELPSDDRSPAGSRGAPLKHLDGAIELLESIIRDRAVLADVPQEVRDRLLRAAGQVAAPDKSARVKLSKARRRLDRNARRGRDETLLGQTGIRSLRAEAVFTTPRLSAPDEAPFPGAAADDLYLDGPEVEEPRNCYICKADFTRLHFFYDSMCPPCAAFNWQKRNQTVDLRGRVAIVTGGRVKIGYQAVIKLLHAGCKVIVTTRFPRDAVKRFAAEPDFDQWHDRLEVLGLDLRHTPSVEAFSRYVLETQDRLDFILNNACQTVRRPPGFYEHMMELEAAPMDGLPEAARAVLHSYATLIGGHDEGGDPHAVSAPTSAPTSGVERSGSRGVPKIVGLTHAASLSQVPLVDGDRVDDREVVEKLFPVGRLDQDLQQVDLRDKNSWRMTLAEVPTVELLEVHLVNAVAPFVMNARLKPLMLRQKTGDKHIVNVSAMEGQFRRSFKTDKHPHTNMAKAALNMLTRTSAPDYAADGIFMNSVDTGWITDEDPKHHQERKIAEHRFHPPLDIVDAAARICDPFIHGIKTGEHVWGRFLKDYRPIDW